VSCTVYTVWELVASALMTVGLERAPLSDQAYQLIKSMIISSEIGPGEPVAESLLAKRLDISRTPVRQALGRLRDDGLVIAEPRKVPFVARLDRKYVEHVYQIRGYLEPLAARQAVELVPVSDIDAFERELIGLKTQINANQLEGIKAAFLNFTAMLLRYNSNDLLGLFVARLQDHVLRIRNAMPPDRDEWLLAEYDYLQVELGHLRARDGQALESVLRQHLEHFRREAIEVWRDLGTESDRDSREMKPTNQTGS
jgi:DNA-binding GntR family transcriptional regulator